MKLNIPVDSIEPKYLTPDVRKKINGVGTEQIINNYVTNTQITNINGVIKAKCVSLTNISLDNTTTIIDDYTLVNNDIILVAGQTDKTENGLYRYDINFIRYNFEAGDLIAILNGTNYANSLWKNINNEIVIGTTLIDFGQIHIINVLNDIGDVNIDTPVNNEVLTYKDGEWVNLEISGLPAGTENQTLRHDGTDWVANDLFRANNGTGFISGTTTAHLNANQYFFRHTAGTTYSDFLLKSTGNNVIYGYIQGVDTVMWLRNSRSRFSILSDNYDAETKTLIITSGVNESFYVKQSGAIKSNSLTANTFLAANANKEIVSRNPNTIKTTTADLTVLTGTASWVDIPLLTVMLEPSVTYELQIMLAIEGAPGRAFKLRLNTAAATYVYRPFVKNTSGVGTDVVYVEDGSSAIPQILDNETEINLTTGNTYHYVEMKGILTTTNNIPNAKLQIYNDSLFGITVKAYSYLKLSR